MLEGDPLRPVMQDPPGACTAGVAGRAPKSRRSSADDCRIAAISQGDELSYRLRPPRPFLARLRAEDRPALLRELDLRERDELRALLRADFLAPRLADLDPFRADRRALFLAPLRADFLLPPLDERRVDFLRGAAREVPVPSRRLGEGSSKSKDDGDDAGEGEGGLSEGKGSIHPEPDQPISI